MLPSIHAPSTAKTRPELDRGVGLVVVLLAQGCLAFSGDAEDLLSGGGGAGGSGGTGGVPSVGGGGSPGVGGRGGDGGEGGELGGASPGCDGPADELCDFMTENCTCQDCAGTAFCNPGQCEPNGVCDINDSCVCADCDKTIFCPPDFCVVNGECNTYGESCQCPDCYQAPQCLDNVNACANGAPDGECDLTGAPADGCACPDCTSVPQCTPCVNDGQCSVIEPCSCQDCATEAGCMDCEDDDVCFSQLEECECADCVGVPGCP